MKRKIKILYTLSEFMFGSKTRQLVDLVDGLNSDIFDIEIASSVIGDEATDEILALNVPVHAIRLYPPHGNHIKAWQAFASSVFKLEKNKYDIIHSLHYSSFYYEALIVKYFTKSKFIYSKSNPEWDNHPFCWNLKSVLADKVVAGSNSLKELMTEKGFESKVHTISYGIDTDFFGLTPPEVKAINKEKNRIPKDNFVFGCAAQFLNWKNHSLLIRAFAILKKKYKNISLLLCGQHYNDTCYDEVMSLIHREALEKAVLYLGVLSDIRNFYKSIDCFVLPSHNEAFGLVYTEAMSCSLPVIGANIGGPKDIISNCENGYLFKSNDLNDLVSVMEYYLEDPALSVKHGVNGRVTVEKYFSKSATVSKHSMLYHSVVQNTAFAVGNGYCK